MELEQCVENIFIFLSRIWHPNTNTFHINQELMWYAYEMPAETESNAQSFHGNNPILEGIFDFDCILNECNSKFRNCLYKQQSTFQSHLQLFNTKLLENDLSSGLIFCAICHDIICQHGKLDLRLLGCGHYFHKMCIINGMRIKMQCPVCRSHILPRIIPTISNNRLLISMRLE